MTGGVGLYARCSSAIIPGGFTDKTYRLGGDFFFFYSEYGCSVQLYRPNRALVGRAKHKHTCARVKHILLMRNEGTKEKTVKFNETFKIKGITGLSITLKPPERIETNKKSARGVNFFFFIANRV